MKRLLACIAVLAAIIPAMASGPAKLLPVEKGLFRTVSYNQATDTAPVTSPFGFTGAYDLSSKKWLALGTYRVGSQHDILGFKGFNVDIYGLAGASTVDGSSVAGFAAGISRPISKEATITFGLAMLTQAGARSHLGAFVSLTGHLGS